MKQLEILAIRLDSPLTTVNPMVLEHISTLRPYTRQLNLLGSRRPRARVPLVVWAWDLVCYPASLLWSPGPRPSPVFRSAICDCLSLNVSISLRERARKR